MRCLVSSINVYGNLMEAIDYSAIMLLICEYDILKYSFNLSYPMLKYFRLKFSLHQKLWLIFKYLLRI